MPQQLLWLTDALYAAVAVAAVLAIEAVRWRWRDPCLVQAGAETGFGHGDSWLAYHAAWRCDIYATKWHATRDNCVDRWSTLQARLMQALLQGCHSSSKIHRSMFSENSYAGAVSRSLLSCQIRYPPMLWPCVSAVLQVNGLQAVFLKWSAREAALWARPCCKLSRGTDSCSGIA